LRAEPGVKPLRMSETVGGGRRRVSTSDLGTYSSTSLQCL
jgi:hypothetical protein